MTNNPFINATGALGYIILIVSTMNLITASMGNKPDTPFAPVVFLSLFVLSAAVMAYVFFYRPLQLLIDGKHKAAVRLITQTIGVFAGITAVGLLLLFSGFI